MTDTVFWMLAAASFGSNFACALIFAPLAGEPDSVTRKLAFIAITLIPFSAVLILAAFFVVFGWSIAFGDYDGDDGF